MKKSITNRSTTESSKKRKKIPLKVWFFTFCTCFFRQAKQHFSMAMTAENKNKTLKKILAFCVLVFFVVLFVKGCSNTFWEKGGDFKTIEADENQETIKDSVSQPSSEKEEIDFENHEFENSVTLYSKGNTAIADKGKVNVDVYNVAESNCNMVLEINISDEELIKNIGTNGRLEESQKDIDAKVKAAKEEGTSFSPTVCIARSGLIFAGNKITVLDLEPLEDGTILPSGTYKAFYKESFYDKEGNLQSVDASLNITLIVK